MADGRMAIYRMLTTMLIVQLMEQNHPNSEYSAEARRWTGYITFLATCPSYS
jgi:hypothetical protein